jgi:hypothetical protein
LFSVGGRNKASADDEKTRADGVIQTGSGQTLPDNTNFGRCQ